MLTLVAIEMLPRAFADGARFGPGGGFLAGAVLMLGLSALLGI